MIVINDTGLEEGIRCALCTNDMANDRGCDGNCVVNEHQLKKVLDVIDKAQIKHFTNGDIIRAIFPTAKVYYDGLVINVQFCETEESWYNEEWWNAPYKQGSKNGNSKADN